MNAAQQRLLLFILGFGAGLLLFGCGPELNDAPAGAHLQTRVILCSGGEPWKTLDAGVTPDAEAQP